MSDYINDINSVGEWVRLEQQAGLVQKATGLLPPLFDGIEFSALLDIGCGPGRWALDIAANRPESRVLGIDVSRDLVNYANARARTQALKNVSFEVQDFLAHALPFPEASFDLLHLRFAVGWVKGYASWSLLLARCLVLLKPGGWLVITEGEGIYTTSRALERLQEIFCEACYRSGYGLSESPRFMGVVAKLGPLLHETGFRAIRINASALDYSYYHKDQEANRAWRHNFQILINEAAPFLLKTGITTSKELAEIEHQLLIDLFQTDFGGIGPLFTFSAQKPEEGDHGKE